MNVATLPAGARPSPYAAVTYRAFRIDNGSASEIRLNRPATLDAAREEAQLACLHKETLAIRETDDDGARVHLFVIRRAAAKWVRQGFASVRVEDLYAEPVCVLPAEVFHG